MLEIDKEILKDFHKAYTRERSERKNLKRKYQKKISKLQDELKLHREGLVSKENLSGSSFSSSSSEPPSKFKPLNISEIRKRNQLLINEPDAGGSGVSNPIIVLPHQSDDDDESNGNHDESSSDQDVNDNGNGINGEDNQQDEDEDEDEQEIGENDNESDY